MTSSNPARSSAAASSSKNEPDNTVAPPGPNLGFFVPQPAGRLPSYKPPSARYHPYRKPEEPPPPRYEDSVLYNTIYDDECEAFLEVPERPPRTEEEEEADRNKLQRLVERIQRIKRLAAVMPEFFDGLRRAVQDG
ncbi:hypothetical protein EST38_g6448 [Candolleomyces aberdarensis]|uniref:Uncharacterized protein n=1 Tax=Candolleomyces aberdarensis TaxID=2316362 RepID=A0A4Q2DKL7_9AGAR|nr:hypothetical protein EST38_g6448 [Candolleomyces aberdarensis]